MNWLLLYVSSQAFGLNGATACRSRACRSRACSRWNGYRVSARVPGSEYYEGVIEDDNDEDDDDEDDDNEEDELDGLDDEDLEDEDLELMMEGLGREFEEDVDSVGSPGEDTRSVGSGKSFLEKMRKRVENGYGPNGGDEKGSFRRQARNSGRQSREPISKDSNSSRPEPRFRSSLTRRTTRRRNRKPEPDTQSNLADPENLQSPEGPKSSRDSSKSPRNRKGSSRRAQSAPGSSPGESDDADLPELSDALKRIMGGGGAPDSSSTTSDLTVVDRNDPEKNEKSAGKSVDERGPSEVPRRPSRSFDEDLKSSSPLRRRLLQRNRGRASGTPPLDLGKGQADDVLEEDDEFVDDNDPEDLDEKTRMNWIEQRRREKETKKRELRGKNSKYDPRFHGRMDQDSPETVIGYGKRAESDGWKGGRPKADVTDGRQELTEDEIKEILERRKNINRSRKRGQREEVQETPNPEDVYTFQDEDNRAVPIGEVFPDEKVANRFASFLGGMNDQKEDESSTFFKRKGVSPLFSAKKKNKDSQPQYQARSNSPKAGRKSPETRKRPPSLGQQRRSSPIPQRGIVQPLEEEYPDYDPNDDYARRPLEWDTKLASDACATCKGDGLVTCPYCLADEWLPPLDEYLSDPVGDAVNQPGNDPSVRYVKKPASPEMLKNLREFWNRPDLAIAGDGWAQCQFCAKGQSLCQACEGSGSRLRKGFDYEAEMREAYPEELHDDVGLDDEDEQYLSFNKHFHRRPQF
ncbi:hypothetical protein NDN08_007936 [Rhodosorus marinus]|uniref:RanBP2-type domain-containing protein n=1 Tax=Rhodosorus marinus TaxID=101924 RepID=A0AAV8V2K3_9RHOD|nr:hypothetical protein NDN08_007936 [Rhodosorus marinus]